MTKDKEDDMKIHILKVNLDNTSNMIDSYDTFNENECKLKVEKYWEENKDEIDSFITELLE